MATILLVEDARDLAQVIARELEASGHHVLVAADGLAALELHARERPDAVILDWMLPKLDGLEVLRRLRQSAPTPVLMLTARGEEADRVVGLEAGRGRLPDQAVQHARTGGAGAGAAAALGADPPDAG